MGANGRGGGIDLSRALGPPSPEVQLLTMIAQTLDQMLQLQGRIALGWDPAAAVADMGLNVKPVPTAEVEA